MIAANELRIGNWVMVNRHKVLVEMIDDSGVNGRESGGEYSSMEYEGQFLSFYSDDPSYNVVLPIPLTSEILEKCGFWAHMDVGYYLPEDPNDKDNLMPKNGFIFNEEMDYHYEDHYAHRSIKIESVHQLQNLYFALTGEELNVQL